MSLMLRAAKRLGLCGLALLASYWVLAQTPYTPWESEYSLTAGLVGDQVHPAVSLSTTGGYVVWQDNAIDGDGWGIGARALDSNLSPVPAHTFRVNDQGAGDQQYPVVQMLPNGGAIFVWQGGAMGNQDIFARILGADGTFSTGDLLVNTYTQGEQSHPSVALLADGGLVIVWTSVGEDGDMKGVFGQRLAVDGTKVGPEFQVNVTSAYNQRSPAVAALAGGDFAVAWISENQTFENSVDVFARRFAANLVARTGEWQVNATTNICANPAVCGTADGGMVVAWSERDIGVVTNGWYIEARGWSQANAPLGAPTTLSSSTAGNRYAPQLARIGDTLLAVWTSDWQDGSRQGVYGRFLNANGTPAGAEFRANTTTISSQMQPAVAADGAKRFLVTWTSFTGIDAGFDLMGQRYSSDQSLAAPGAPIVSALDSYSLLVAWPPLAGDTNGVTYQLYVDGNGNPIETTTNYYVLGNLSPNSTNYFQLAYRLANGQVSPRSATAVGTTWGPDLNYDGLPDNWEAKYFGSDPTKWPPPTADSDGDGINNLGEFLAGTDPTNPASALKVKITSVTNGLLVSWPVEPGSIYQLQSSADLSHWTSVGDPLFAASSLASQTVPLASAAKYYRVIRIR